MSETERIQQQRRLAQGLVAKWEEGIKAQGELMQLVVEVTREVGGVNDGDAQRAVHPVAARLGIDVDTALVLYKEATEGVAE